MSDRIQQLIDAGVAKDRSAFSSSSQKLIASLSDDEFNCLLSLRTKILANNGESGQQEFDKIVCVVI